MGVVAGLLLCSLVWCMGESRAADLVLNEYNAVGDGRRLEQDGSDPFWGRRLGNGGDWFELVVITDHLDARGWRLEVSNATDDPLNRETFLLELTQADIWSDLRSGTIVTVSERLRSQTGPYEPAAGRWWINARASREDDGEFAVVSCVAPSCDPAAANWKVSSAQWQLTIRDALGDLVFGPAGEGIQPPAGVGGAEVVKLEQDPGADVSPQSNYQDGQSSSFGLPNVFDSGNSMQNFSVLRSVVPYAPLTTVRINEVFVHSDPGIDWIELVNTGAAVVAIGGWYLSDSFADLTKFVIPPGTVIQPGGFLDFDEVELGFALSSPCGDEAVLSAAAGGIPTGARDFVEFGAVDNGVALGRIPDGGDRFGRLLSPTRGGTNSAALVSPVVINEIMYDPPPPGPGVTVDPEFVELHNLSDLPVELFTGFGLDGTFPWKISGGIDFAFPLTATIEPHGYLLVVSFDPVLRPDLLAQFRDVYALNATVRVFGPYDGGLNNFSDRVRLAKPDGPEDDGDICGGSGNPAPYVPYVVVDEVEYVDFNPWPEAAAGAGASLERVDPRAPADDPTNWHADAGAGPTPGSANSGSPTTTTLPPAECTVDADCNDNDPCTIDACVAQSCRSDAATPDGTPCSDGSFCNGTDTCSAALCALHTGDPCAGRAECSAVCDEAGDRCATPAGTPCADDGNVCTVTACDGFGSCSAIQVSDPCDDGLACTTGDTCSDGSCVGSPPCDPRCSHCDGVSCASSCGVPASLADEPSVVDALFILRSSVMAVSCAPCICDVDRSGSVSASDALRTLRRAVGIPLELQCPTTP